MIQILFDKLFHQNIRLMFHMIDIISNFPIIIIESTWIISINFNGIIIINKYHFKYQIHKNKMESNPSRDMQIIEDDSDFEELTSLEVGIKARTKREFYNILATNA